jgi:hypothetical protein
LGVLPISGAQNGVTGAESLRHELFDRPPEELAPRAQKHPLQLGVDQHDAAIRSHKSNAVRRELDDLGKYTLDIVQGRAGCGIHGVHRSSRTAPQESRRIKHISCATGRARTCFNNT